MPFSVHHLSAKILNGTFTANLTFSVSSRYVHFNVMVLSTIAPSNAGHRGLWAAGGAKGTGELLEKEHLIQNGYGTHG